MSNYFQNRNASAASNNNSYSGGQGQSATQYTSGWIKTEHKWPKIKDSPALDAKCIECGIVYGDVLESTPCKTRDLQYAERRIAEQERKIAELQRLLEGQSKSGGDPTAAASSSYVVSAVRRERDMSSN